MAFSLPPDISSQKQLLSNGAVYTFRHRTLGELGRIVLQEASNGHSHISSEVVGDADDPMTATRRELFLPLSQQITQALEAGLRASGKMAETTGVPSATVPPPSPSVPQEKIASKLVPCPRCGAPAALLVFADQARSVGELEDYARKMYSHYKQLNVHTWILGAPRRLPDNDISCATFKVWPERETIQELRPDEFNQQVDRLLERHC